MQSEKTRQTKKACVSTYCEWTSYGSVMQAIGLKTTLLQLGIESFIVRDVPAPAPQKSFGFQFSKCPKMLVKAILSIKYRKHRERMYAKNIDFIRKNVDIMYFNDYLALKSHPPIADFYIAGSDAIWHPHLCKDVFFLDFLPENKKRVSYAASMNKTVIPDDKKEKFSALVSKMDCISVRERDVADNIAQFTDKKASVHIDPSFLLTSDDWRAMSKKYDVSKPYILVYSIFWDKKLNKELKKLRKRTGFKIVALCPGGVSSVWANKKIFDADPGEFLYLVDHAEAVVSSSFHGIALALNLNKKIAPVINPSSPSRIQNLLDTLGVEFYEIEDVLNFDLASYSGINEKISEERERSITYLQEVLV